MTDDIEEVRVTASGSGVATVTIDRPASLNALNLAVKNRLADVIAEVDSDPDVRVIVVAGGPRAFAAGTDLLEMATMTPTEHTLQASDRMFTTLRRCGTPLIAAVEGFALGGGCELAMACDLIVAGRSAQFGQPEILVGVMPGAGGTQRLVRVLGRYRALRLLLTGARLTGEEAFGVGLVSELAPDGEALDAALRLAELIAGMPQLAVRAILDVIEAGADVPLEAALLLERKAFQLLFDSADQEEGMRAFLEKRSPTYRGV